MHESLMNLYSSELGRKHCEGNVRRRLERQVGKSVTAKIKSRYGIAGKRILDDGSGFGEVSIEMARAGGLVSGIEPDRERLLLSRRFAKKEKVPVDFRLGYAENLPFQDGHFDIVVSNAVIEHVKDVEKTLSEMARVVRPGGVIYISVPNYLFPHEDHYKVPFPPLAPKSLARIYLRMLGRKPDFINTINYITMPALFRTLRGLGMRVIPIRNAAKRAEPMTLIGIMNYMKALVEFILWKLMLHPRMEIFAEKP
jgi:2-polyprenyl-3-methyl-5-hydroxy-6-metoxy-1,4-benzoquinol methylase